MEKITKRICYYCKVEKDVSEMQQIVVWFCNKCAEKFKTSDKKKK
jgi:ribosomal protein L37AE/L43A